VTRGVTGRTLRRSQAVSCAAAQRRIVDPLDSLSDARCVKFAAIVTLAAVSAACRLGFDRSPHDGGDDGSGDDVPTQLAPVGIAAGDRFTCALRPDAFVWCWGDNRRGQLGDGTLVPRATPAKIGGLAGAVEIAAGFQHACARLGDGSVMCWGSNDHGQLGDGTQTQRPAPVMVQSLPGAATALSLGGGHSCALVGSDLYCWGDNEDGEVGAMGAPIEVMTPSKALDSVTAVAAGQSSALLGVI